MNKIKEEINMNYKYFNILKILEMFNVSVSLPGIESLPRKVKTKEKRKFQTNDSKINSSRIKLLD